MATWDLYRCQSQTVERGLTTEALRASLASGDVRPDDLVRPAGRKAPWTRLRDVPALAWPDDRVKARLEPSVRPTLPPAGLLAHEVPAVQAGPEPVNAQIDDDEIEELEEVGAESEALMAEPVEDVEDDDELQQAIASRGESLVGSASMGFAGTDDFNPEGEHDDEGGFSLASGAGEEEELDLTAMVDIAMQLIMFFLVTATTIMFKSIEIPNPDPEKQDNAQQAPKNLDELENQNILVEIDPKGQITVDHEPITPSELIPKLRAARDATGRTGMILMADLATPHKNAVLAYEAANEVGLAIKIGRPAAGMGDEGF